MLRTTIITARGMRCAAAALISSALAVSAAAQSQQPQGTRQKQQEATRTVGSSIIVDAEEIARNPSKYIGKTVMIQPDDVNRVISPHAFLLDEDAVFAGPDILVLVPSPARAVSAGEDVMVTGTVRAFIAADIERDFDWFDADDIDIEFQGRPVIVAHSVRTSEGRELAGVIAKVPETRTARGAQPAQISAGELAENAEQYIGRRVTVRAEIEDVYNPQLFTLDEDRMFVGPDVIVYAKDGRMAVTEEHEDEVVTVTGTVAKFIDTELFGSATWFEPWFNDLDETGRGLVRSRPVIMVDSITSSAGAQIYTSGESRTPAAKDEPAERAVGTAGMAAERTGGAATAGAPNQFVAGNNVSLTGTVSDMATDRAFWLRVEGRNQPIMVIVDAANLDRMTGGAWKPDVDTRVTVSGVVKEVPGTEGTGKITDWGLNADDAKRLKEQRIYIHAQKLTPSKQ